MFIFKAHQEPPKPNYGKVIALTAITVAAIETAAVIGIAIAKKVIDAKRKTSHIDEDFIMIPHTDDCAVHFEETDDKAEA